MSCNSTDDILVIDISLASCWTESNASPGRKSNNENNDKSMTSKTNAIEEKKL